MKTHVNLLPLKYRRAALIRSLLVRWCAVWFGAVAILAGMYSLNASGYRNTAADVTAKEAQCRPILTTAKANRGIRTEVRRFEHRETLVGQLREDKPALNFLAVVGNGARQSAGRVVIRDLQFEQNTAKGSGARDAKSSMSDRPEAVLTIEGEALDNLAIAQFAAGLRDAGLFHDVELKSSVKKASSPRQVRTFVIRCEI